MTASIVDRSTPLTDEDISMSLRDDIAGVVARDPRYAIHAYGFVFEALEHAKKTKARRLPQVQPKSARERRDLMKAQMDDPRHNHVSGRDLCEAARDLAQRLYGLLAATVLAQWGVRSTSDLGNIVYNMIHAGALEQSPDDSRAEFDNVFDFDEAFRRNYVLVQDEAA